MQIPLNKVPLKPEMEMDPKQTLINLARRARKKRLASDIVPAIGSKAQIGPLYNVRMSEFVIHQWDIQRASESSESLKRAMRRIDEFNEVTN